jgi:acyl carrier protein
MILSEHAVGDRLREIAAPLLHVTPQSVPLDVALIGSLGLDSLDVIAFLVRVEAAFPEANIREWDGDRESTLQDLVEYIRARNGPG